MEYEKTPSRKTFWASLGIVEWVTSDLEHGAAIFFAVLLFLFLFVIFLVSICKPELTNIWLTLVFNAFMLALGVAIGRGGRDSKFSKGRGKATP